MTTRPDCRTRLPGAASGFAHGLPIARPGAATGDQASPVAKLRGARPRHQQLPPSHCRACAFRLSRRRCVFAHRAAGRGAGPRQPSQRRCHRAHHRGAARLPRQDGGEGRVRARVSSPPRPAGSPRTAPPSSTACATSSTSSSRSSTARPRPISPSRAARRSSIPKAHSVIVFDIGGGSTEIAWLDGQAPHAFADPCKRIRAWDSLPVGVVTLAERHGGIEVTPESFRGHGRGGHRAPARFRPRGGPGRARARNFHLLGTSGTVTTVGGIHLGLARYDRRRVDGMWMRNGEISTVIDRLLHSDFRRARRESLHRQGPGRSGSRRLRHFGSDPAGLPLGPPAHRGSRTARRNFDEHDARGFGVAAGGGQR